MALKKIVTGGQTGVDRGALDAALDAGFPCGGWCPTGRKAEDGAIPARYPLTALAGGYRSRTLRNVLESDGTVILQPGEPEGGTKQTLLYCQEHRKPCRIVDASRASPRQAAGQIAEFVSKERISVLNVAGPRESKWPGAHDYAYSTVRHLLGVLPGRGC